jgi:hypothetical protein
MKKTAPPARLTMAQAAKALGVTPDFVLTLALNGARKPADQGGEVVEIDYGMEGDEVTFTKQGIDRFLKRCPVGDLVNSTVVEKHLGVHRAQVSMLVYTGIPSEDGRILRLPVWVVGGREYVAKNELEAFAEHFKAWVERKAARELKKRYTRPNKQAQEA